MELKKMYLLQILEIVTFCHIRLSNGHFTYVVWPYVPFVGVSDDLWEHAQLTNGFLNQSDVHYDKESIDGLSVNMLRHLLKKCVENKASKSLKLKAVLPHARNMLETPPYANFYLPMHFSLTRMAYFQQIARNETFIPLIESPGMWLLTTPTHYRSFEDDLKAGWPLCVFLAGISSVAGLVMWVLEKDASKSIFPKPVARGIEKGAWWAIVSMTTVGKLVFLLLPAPQYVK